MTYFALALMYGFYSDHALLVHDNRKLITQPNKRIKSWSVDYRKKCIKMENASDHKTLMEVNCMPSHFTCGWDAPKGQVKHIHFPLENLLLLLFSCSNLFSTRWLLFWIKLRSSSNFSFHSLRYFGFTAPPCNSQCSFSLFHFFFGLFVHKKMMIPQHSCLCSLSTL